MVLIIFWCAMAIIPAMIASKKGRNGFAWFLYGIIFWPIAIVHAILVSDLAQQERERKARLYEAASTKSCPRCAESIKFEAKVCRFCGYEYPGHDEAAA